MRSLWTLNMWWFLWFYCNQFCKVNFGFPFCSLLWTSESLKLKLGDPVLTALNQHSTGMSTYSVHTIDCQHYILREFRFTNTNFWKQDHAKNHHITCRSVSVEEIFWSSRSWTIWLASCWYSATTRRKSKGASPQYMNFWIAHNASIDPVDHQKAGMPVNRLSEAGDFAAGCMGSTMEIKWFRQQYPGNRTELLMWKPSRSMHSVSL